VTRYGRYIRIYASDPIVDVQPNLTDAPDKPNIQHRNSRSPYIKIFITLVIPSLFLGLEDMLQLYHCFTVGVAFVPSEG